MLPITKHDGQPGESQTIRVLDSLSQPEKVMFHLQNIAEDGTINSSGIYLDFEDAAQIRDWIDNWMVDHWPQE
jgi:hypothetical protein